MQRVDDRLILAASDLIDYLECAHLTHLDLDVLAGRVELEATRTDAADLVARKGEEHEFAHLASLRSQGREVVEIESEAGLDGIRRGAERTLQAIRAGSELIYQGVLFDPAAGERDADEVVGHVGAPNDDGSVRAKPSCDAPAPPVSAG